MTVTSNPSLHDVTLQTDALIARLDASMIRIQALTDRLTAKIEERNPDDERER